MTAVMERTDYSKHQLKKSVFSSLSRPPMITKYVHSESLFGEYSTNGVSHHGLVTNKNVKMSFSFSTISAMISYQVVSTLVYMSCPVLSCLQPLESVKPGVAHNAPKHLNLNLCHDHYCLSRHLLRQDSIAYKKYSAYLLLSRTAREPAPLPSRIDFLKTSCYETLNYLANLALDKAVKASSLSLSLALFPTPSLLFQRKHKKSLLSKTLTLSPRQIRHPAGARSPG